MTHILTSHLEKYWVYFLQTMRMPGKYHPNRVPVYFFTSFFASKNTLYITSYNGKNPNNIIYPINNLRNTYTTGYPPFSRVPEGLYNACIPYFLFLFYFKQQCQIVSYLCKLCEHMCICKGFPNDIILWSFNQK